jgi:hypothetical protein
MQAQTTLYELQLVRWLSHSRATKTLPLCILKVQWRAECKAEYGWNVRTTATRRKDLRALTLA